MRIFLFVAAFLSAVCSFSQVKDNFSDGDFTNNPVWTGDSDKFTVDKNGMLRLNDTGKTEGYAVLSTQSALMRGAVWEFYVHLSFNPSARNYARFYLASSSADLSGELRGYFLEIGGAEDAVCLYRQDGETGEPLIGGRSLMKAESSLELKIKVHCSREGEWEVWTQRLNRETDYTSEGTMMDTTYSESAFAGVVCVYTSSRWNSFAFDDFLIAGEKEESAEPSEPDRPAEPFDPDEPEGPQVDVQTTPFGCIVFNEIMASPKGVAGLPEAEYIELYNRRGVSVSLKGWKLHDGKRSYELPSAQIPPHGYLVLCHEKYLSVWADYPPVPVGMPSFPVLSDRGNLLYIENSRNELVAWVDYSDRWYSDSGHPASGNSLECRDPDNLSGCAGNWSGSDDGRGGTPGELNSVAASFPDETAAEVFYYYLESPDTLMIRFIKPIDLPTLSCRESYVFRDPYRAVWDVIPGYPAARSVEVVFSPPLSVGETCDVELDGLVDISGYDCRGNLVLNLALPQTAGAGEVTLNEILFNPSAGGEDYVELYNLSEKQIPLNTLFFSSRNAEGGLSKPIPIAADGRPFLPHTYFCLTKNRRVVCDLYAACPESVVEIASLPSLPRDKGNILLIDSAGTVLDELVYSEKIHTALLKDKKGIALEKSHPSLPSSVSSHWHSASSGSGGGTPGCRNSQYRELPDTSGNEFLLEEPSFSPDGDGLKDELIITYHFSGEDFLANCRIYDTSAREVCVLAKDYRLAAQGRLSWDGKDSAGRVVRAGLYILSVEAFNPAGEVRHFKLACAVTK